MEFKSLFILCRCSSNATCSRNCSMSTFMQLFLTGCVSRTHCCWILRSFSFRLCFARRKLKYSLNEFMLKTIIMQINSFFVTRKGNFCELYSSTTFSFPIRISGWSYYSTVAVNFGQKIRASMFVLRLRKILEEVAGAK